MSEPALRNRPSWRTWHRLGTVVAIGLVTVLACGRVPAGGDNSSTSAASAPRTTSPAATSLPDPTRLTTQNCAGAPSTSPSRALGGYYTMRPASGWTDTGDYVHTESLLLELTAPASYGDAPTRIKFLALPIDVRADFGPQATAHSIAADHVAKHLGSSAQSVATSVADCSVAAESAALFGYADGNDLGYRLVIVHNDRLLEIWMAGSGGISDQALQDSLGMMGSIAWTF